MEKGITFFPPFLRAVGTSSKRTLFALVSSLLSEKANFGKGERRRREMRREKEKNFK